MLQAVWLGATIVSTSALVVMGCLSILAGALRPRRTQAQGFSQSQQDAVFIFRDDRLVDCSDRAQALLGTLVQSEGAAAASDPHTLLMDYLATHFPELRSRLQQLAPSGQCSLHPASGQDMRLDIRVQDRLVSLRLADGSDEGALVAIDRLSHEAAQRELAMLRHTQRHLPCLVWQCDGAGRVIWANAAYIAALQDEHGDTPALSWPLPALFDVADAGQAERLSLGTGAQMRWFSHSRVVNDGMVTHFAIPVDAAVQSEAARREIMQTLTRTFASLPIGLALFDADRRLQVFNPALVDLTGLQPMFLAARPSFEQVLYSLREARMLPEPKDFNAWRRDILDMEKAAQDGAYSEEWSLDGGKTYLVTGRPQPNGAIALFMQDITSEATLTRSFRAEIETAHTVLDQIAPAVIVFGLDGQTLLANAAYAQLWQVDPCTNLADRGLPDALALWARGCGPTAFWARLAEFVAIRAEADSISGMAQHRSIGTLRLTARRLAGGNTLLMFEAQEDQPARRARDLQSEALLRPDAGQPPAPCKDQLCEELEAILPGAADTRPSRPRTARHAGNRLRV